MAEIPFAARPKRRGEAEESRDICRCLDSGVGLRCPVERWNGKPEPASPNDDEQPSQFTARGRRTCPR